MPDPRYPIGRFIPPSRADHATRAQAIDHIAATPAGLRAAVSGLDERQLDTPYRPGGWTVRQLVHHVPDSHLNAYLRVKLALTEDVPTIKPYDEARWAELADSRTTPVATSLDLLANLHERWVHLFRSFRAEDFSRRYRHPETGEHDLDHLLALYAWHGAHHTAHVTALRAANNW
jgi:DinB superfamily